ncbi:MAG: hypothetical protein KIG70_09680, partial [Treponema sp.]|uniref:hypothetical protein n=1 Tax=Treponema sp. TaxID=166 RepID=UPI001D9C6632
SMTAKELKQNKASEDALSLPQADKNQNSDFKKTRPRSLRYLSIDHPLKAGRRNPAAHIDNIRQK